MDPVNRQRETFGRRQFMTMAGRGAATLAGGAWALTQLAATARAQGQRPPNIVFILADDLGWADSAPYGSTLYETPNLTRLASQGTLFTEAYAAAPLCSPTRASIMTGRYPHRLRLTGAIVCPPSTCTEIDDPQERASAQAWMKVTTPEFRTYLPLTETTIAEALKTAGYATAHIGKWHLGNQAWWPNQQGFDVNIGGGHYPSPPSYFSPYNIATLTNGPKGEYLTDRLTTEAENYMTAHKDEPFFLSFWHYAVHGPYQAKPDLIAKYTANVDPLAAHRNPTYAAMVEGVDQSVGRVLDKIDALGLASQTIVFFFSDNGGVTYVPGQSGEYITSNAPLRGGKAHIYDGGTREAFIVRWPGHVAAGAVNRETVVSSVDFFPTMLALAGLTPPAGVALDGENLLPVLTGTGTLARDAIYCHFPHYIVGHYPTGTASGDSFLWTVPASYVRQGDWKLIRHYGEGATKTEDRLELFNLRDDIGEQHDRSAQEPARTAAMAALLAANLQQTQALMPRPNPAHGQSFNGWSATKNTTISVQDGALRSEAYDVDPILTGPSFNQTAPVQVHLRLKTVTANNGGQIFWSTGSEAGFAGTRRVDFTMTNDGQWHDYALDLPVAAPETVTKLRFDPGGDAGVVEIAWIRVVRQGAGTVLEEWNWSLADPAAPVGGWHAGNHVLLTARAGRLHVSMTGDDPQLLSWPFLFDGPIRVALRLRIQGSGPGQLFWALNPNATFAGTRRLDLPLIHDGQWHEYSADLPLTGGQRVIQLRLDLGDGPGEAEIDSIRIFQPTGMGEVLLGAWDFGLALTGSSAAQSWALY